MIWGAVEAQTGFSVRNSRCPSGEQFRLILPWKGASGLRQRGPQAPQGVLCGQPPPMPPSRAPGEAEPGLLLELGFVRPLCSSQTCLPLFPAWRCGYSLFP